VASKDQKRSSKARCLTMLVSYKSVHKEKSAVMVIRAHIGSRHVYFFSTYISSYHR